MEPAQYWIALVTIVTVPPAGLAWFIIHPFTRFWRKVGLGITYTVMLALVLLQAAGLLLIRRWLLSVHYGVSWPLVVFAS